MLFYEHEVCMGNHVYKMIVVVLLANNSSLKKEFYGVVCEAFLDVR